MPLPMKTGTWLATHNIPVRITGLVKDLIAYKKGIVHNIVSMDDDKKRKMTVTLYGIPS